MSNKTKPTDKSNLKVIKGSAGTGKTTEIINIIKDDPEHFIICALTNKALSVIKNKLDEKNIKGCHLATIHKAFFKATPIEGRTKKVKTPVFNQITKKQEIDENGERMYNETEEPIFEFSFSEKNLYKCFNILEKLTNYTVIIDEASMIPADIAYHLASVQMDLILVGDDKQLPPIESTLDGIKSSLAKINKTLETLGDVKITNLKEVYLSQKKPLERELQQYSPYRNWFKNLQPTSSLNTVYRQKKDSDILFVANSIINGTVKPFVPCPLVSPSRGVISIKLNPLTWKNYRKVFSEVDVVLAYKVDTCTFLNTLIRGIKHKKALSKVPGSLKNLPVIGDILYVTKSYSVTLKDEKTGKDKNQIIVPKGDTIRITSINDHSPADSIMYVDAVDNQNPLIKYNNLPINLGFVLGKNIKNTVNRAEVVYGYAITVHKAQGSQYKNVCVVDDGCQYANKEWYYTAITRASESLTFFHFPSIKGVIK